MDHVIHSVYFDPASPACFAGVDTVLREAKKRMKSIQRRDVIKFLQAEDTYTLHKPVRKRFRRNKMTAPGIDVSWQCDLIDVQTLKKYNNQNAWILCCIDVFSRYAFTEPLRTKEQSNTTQAFERIMKRSGRKPIKLFSDRGGEFGSKFDRMLESHQIQHIQATDDTIKCALVERFIRTIKTRLWRYFTMKKTHNFTRVLQQLTTAYNNTRHRTIGQTPASVTKENSAAVWERAHNPGKTTLIRYKLGDKVRIPRKKNIFSKGYTTTFQPEVYTISKVLANRNPVAYKLDGARGIFYAEKLSKVAERTGVYEVEKVIRTRKLKGREREHLVKWKIDGSQSWVKESELFE